MKNISIVAKPIYAKGVFIEELIYGNVIIIGNRLIPSNLLNNHIFEMYSEATESELNTKPTVLITRYFIEYINVIESIRNPINVKLVIGNFIFKYPVYKYINIDKFKTKIKFKNELTLFEPEFASLNNLTE